MRTSLATEKLLPEETLAIWCRIYLGATPVSVLFQERHLSRVTGVRLSDGREVVIKVREPASRLAGCHRVQQHLWQAGYPCPEPLVPPQPFGELTATAEAYVPGGEELSPGPDSPRLFADALVGLVQACSSMREAVDLEPPQAWVGWRHHEDGIWPPPDDSDADLNQHHDPAWLDHIGATVRERLLSDGLPRVIGHCDWWQPNLRWAGRRLHVVFDFDSMVSLSEAAIAGAAAAQFSVTTIAASSVEESEAFLAAYEMARGKPWSTEEREIAWTAGVWLIAFNARKQILEGNFESLEHLRDFGAQRMRRAGLR